MKSVLVFATVFVVAGTTLYRIGLSQNGEPLQASGSEMPTIYFQAERHSAFAQRVEDVRQPAPFRGWLGTAQIRQDSKNMEQRKCWMITWPDGVTIAVAADPEAFLERMEMGNSIELSLKVLKLMAQEYKDDLDKPSVIRIP